MSQGGYTTQVRKKKQLFVEHMDPLKREGEFVHVDRLTAVTASRPTQYTLYKLWHTQMAGRKNGGDIRANQ